MSFINIEAMANAEYTRSKVVQMLKARNTRQQLADHYQQKKQLKAKMYDHDELICTYETKKLIKAVFITDELNRTTFKRFIQMKNELGAEKIVVHCLFAYVACDTLEVILNREE